MNRYAPATGIVRNIADDLTDTQSNMESNRRVRAGVVLGAGNLKLTGPESFDLSWQNTGTAWNIRCSGITAIHFNDGALFAPEAETVASAILPLTDNTYYVVLGYHDVYSEPAEFVPGAPYPLDSTIGKNTLKSTAVTLSVITTSTFSPSSDVVIYKILVTPASISILADYRILRGITMPTVSSVIIPGAIADAHLSTVYGSDIGTIGETILPPGTINKIYNTDSSLNKETMLRVSWTPATNAWFYEIKVIPYFDGVANSEYSIRHIKIADALPEQSILIPMANKQIVDVSITPFSPSMGRETGASFNFIGFNIGEDRAPSTEASISMGITILNTAPRTAKFTVTTTGISPTSRIKIYMESSTKSVTLYKGHCGAIICRLPIGTWTPKVVSYSINGDVEASFSCSSLTVPASSSSKDTEFLQTIPIATFLNKDLVDQDDNNFYTFYGAAFFFAPTGGGQINKAIFTSCGSFLYHYGSETFAYPIPISFSIRPRGDGDWKTVLEISDDESGSEGWPPTYRQINPQSQTGLYNAKYSAVCSQEDGPIPLISEVLYEVRVSCPNLYNQAGGSTYHTASIVGTLYLSITPPIEYAGIE